MRRRSTAALAVLALLLAACGAGKTAGAPAGVGGKLLITRAQALYERDLASGKERALFNAPPNEFINYPVWSPDGSHFAYILETPFQGNLAADWGSDLWLADANGANQQLLLKHDRPGVEVASPSWTPDGRAIVFGYSYVEYDSSGKYVSQTLETRRLDLATGAVTTLVKNGTYPELCADGSRLTWVNFPPDGSSPEAIMVGNADGSGGQAIVTADASGNGLQDFSYPRFSPDCRRIIFGAVGGNPGAQQLRPAGPPARLLAPLLPRPAEAHGPPWDLWEVNVDGSGLTRLTHVSEDLPYPVWSRDGQTVLFIGTYGIYEMPAAGGGLKKIATGSVHAQIAWWQT